MFSSSCCWQNIQCPYLNAEGCWRPYCPFEHHNAERHSITKRLRDRVEPRSSLIEEYDPSNIQSASIASSFGHSSTVCQIKDLVYASTSTQSLQSISNKLTASTMIYRPTPIAELKRREKLKEKLRNSQEAAQSDCRKLLSLKPAEDFDITQKVDKPAPLNLISNGLKNLLSDDESPNQSQLDRKGQNIPLELSKDTGDKPEIVLGDSSSTDASVEEGHTTVEAVEQLVENARSTQSSVLELVDVFGEDSDDYEKRIKAYQYLNSTSKALTPRLNHSLRTSDEVLQRCTARSHSGKSLAYVKRSAASQIRKGPMPTLITTSKIPIVTAAQQTVQQPDADYVESAIKKKKKRVSRVPEVPENEKRPRVQFDPACRIPISTRQRYLNMFIDEFLKQTGDENRESAYDLAKREEEDLCKSVHSCKGYTVSAVNRLKRIRNGIGLLSLRNAEGQYEEDRVYEALLAYVLSEQDLRDHGFPHPDEMHPTRAIYYQEAVSKLYRREDAAGALEAKYSCCQSGLNSSGCCISKYHVTDMYPDTALNNYILLNSSDGKQNVFAVDCEMVYTTMGPSLARVTVVDWKLNVVYERTVKPEGHLLDCNTRFSGLTEDVVLSADASLSIVQRELSNILNEQSILIGHSLENDLRALKIIHRRVIDTSVVFPHRLGLPYKRGLKMLAIEYLKKVIQEADSGHDSREDASVCIELIKWKIAQDFA